MSPTHRSSLLSRLLFLVTVLLAAILLGLVVLAPYLASGEPNLPMRDRVIAVFARDQAIRRTALASALGLIVTACVFFRTPAAARRPKASQLPPPPDIAGA